MHKSEKRKIELGSYFSNKEEIQIHKGDDYLIVLEKTEVGKPQQICVYKSGADAPLVESDGRTLTPASSETKDASLALSLISIITGEKDPSLVLSRHFYNLPDNKEVLVHGTDSVISLRYHSVMPNYIRTLMEDCIEASSNMLRSVKSATGNPHLWLEIQKKALNVVFPNKGT